MWFVFPKRWWPPVNLCCCRILILLCSVKNCDICSINASISSVTDVGIRATLRPSPLTDVVPDAIPPPPAWFSIWRVVRDVAWPTYSFVTDATGRTMRGRFVFLDSHSNIPVTVTFIHYRVRHRWRLHSPASMTCLPFICVTFRRDTFNANVFILLRVVSLTILIRRYRLTTTTVPSAHTRRAYPAHSRGVFPLFDCCLPANVSATLSPTRYLAADVPRRAFWPPCWPAWLPLPIPAWWPPGANADVLAAYSFILKRKCHSRYSPFGWRFTCDLRWLYDVTWRLLTLCLPPVFILIPFV